MQYVRVVTNVQDLEFIEIPTEDDGTLTVSALAAQYPGATGLKYRLDGHTRVVKLTNGIMYPPENGWGDNIYYCNFPKFVHVTKFEDSEPIEIPTEDDGTLTVSALAAQYPGATGLKYRLDGHTRVVKLTNGIMYPPENGWGDNIYYCNFPEDMLQRRQIDGQGYDVRIPVSKLQKSGKTELQDDAKEIRKMNQLDFTRLPSKQSYLLTPQNKNLRKDFYLVWTNSENLRELFRSVLLQIDFFFRTYLLEITGSYVPEKDILYVLTSMPKEKLRISEHVSNQPQTIQVNLDVSDHPVSIPVYIANTILSAHDRTFASTKLNKIGCQYLYIHKHMLDSSTPTSSASEDLLDQEGQPLLKKMRTCQKAKYVKCDGDLKRHRENSCTLTENKLCVDVLIYCSSEKVNLNLAKYLGLISLEACIKEADVNANYDEVFDIQMDNKNAKIYRLAQAYVNRKLMMGYSNICLTCTYDLFKYAQANVKACIFTKSDSTSDIVDFSARACFCVKIENEQNIAEFIAAVTNIINQVLKVKSSIKAVFCRSDDQLCKSFETTEIPLTCVVPLYILRYFSQVLISQSGLEELSYSSI